MKRFARAAYAVAFLFACQLLASSWAWADPPYPSSVAGQTQALTDLVDRTGKNSTTPDANSLSGRLKAILERLISGITVSDGSGPVTVDGTVAATQSGSWTVGLPSGASTAALQTSGNASLTSVDGKLSSQATAANQALANTKLDTVISQTDAVEAPLASIDSKLSSQATAANQALEQGKLDTVIAQTDGLETQLGLTSATACATDNGTCDLNALIKRTNQRLTSILTGPLPVSQSGAWTVGLPSGAATAALQSASQAPVAPATATATASEVVGCENRTTAPTFTNTQQGAAQCGTRGALIVQIADANGTASVGASSFADGVTSGNYNALKTQASLYAYNGTTIDVVRSVKHAVNSNGIGALQVGPVGECDDTSTVLGSEDQFAPLRVECATRALYVAALALPLPSGASTAANQTSGNSSLATIASNTTTSASNGSTVAGAVSGGKMNTRTDGMDDGATFTASATASGVMTLTGGGTSAGVINTDGSGYIIFETPSVGSSNTLVLESAPDATNFKGTPACDYQTTGGAASQVLSLSTTRIWVAPVTGKTMRFNVSAYGSGTVTVTGAVKRGPAPVCGGTYNVTASGNGLTVQGAQSNGSAVAGGGVRVMGSDSGTARDVKVNSTGEVAVSLPTGASTSANQTLEQAKLDTVIASAASIDGKLTDAATATGSASSAASVVTLNTTGYGYVAVQFTSVGSGNTIVAEHSSDGVAGTGSTFVAGPLWRTSTSTDALQLSAAGPGTGGLWIVPVLGNTTRLRISSYGSGTVTIFATPKRAPPPPPNVVQVAGSLSGGAVAVSGPAAHDAAIGGSPVRTGGRAVTANYTAVSAGDVADFISTLHGAQVTKPYAVPELDWAYAAASGGIANTTTAVTIRAAGGSNVRNCLTGIDVSTDALGSATELAIRDGAGGTVLWRMKLQTTALPGFSRQFASPICGGANTLLEVVTLTAATGGVYVNASGFAD